MASEDTTSKLLSFVDMASSNIKLALDKPGKSKRRVNHRKYLQKQLKRCGNSAKKSKTADSEEPPTKIGENAQDLSPSDLGATFTVTNFSSTGATLKPPSKKEATQSGLQKKSLQALFDPRTLHEKCCTEPSKQKSGGQKVPLRRRNLPASFFVEPALLQKNASPVMCNTDVTQDSGPASAETKRGFLGNQDLNEILSDAWHDEGGSSTSSTTPCSMGSVSSPGPLVQHHPALPEGIECGVVQQSPEQHPLPHSPLHINTSSPCASIAPYDNTHIGYTNSQTASHAHRLTQSGQFYPHLPASFDQSQLAQTGVLGFHNPLLTTSHRFGELGMVSGQYGSHQNVGNAYYGGMDPHIASPWNTQIPGNLLPWQQDNMAHLASQECYNYM